MRKTLILPGKNFSLPNRISTLLASLLILSANFAQSEIPKLEPSIEDPSTGLNVQPGFAVELIHKVDKSQHGSWVSMAFDDKGRLTVSDQGKAGTFTLEVPK